MTAPRIEARGITVRFGAFTAVRDVTLSAAPGEILAIAGENGAGKSTLMNALFGLVRPSSGQFLLDGAPLAFAGARDAIRAGVGMVHQHFKLVPTLTVAENVALGDEPSKNGVFDAGAARARVATLAGELGFRLDPDAVVGSLPVGSQQRVEIVKSLARGARTLILDEPTAVLTPQESDDLFRVVRAVAARGTTVLFISHKLGEVVSIASRVAVLRAGSLVATVETATTTPRAIATLMVGRELADSLPRAAHAPGEVALSFEGVSSPPLRDVSFQLRAGEILGIAGVEGNGQSELVALAAGLLRPASGTITLIGADVTRGTPRDRFSRGLAHVPGDRLRDGVAAGLTVEENLLLGRQRDRGFSRYGGLLRGAIRRHAETCEENFDVRPRDIGRVFGSLSGGNQQKAVIARELSRRPSVLIAAHPTRGVDVGAVEAIHRRLLAERDRGTAVLLVSSDLAEILALSDRVAVLYNGRIVHETIASATNERALGVHMLGAA